MCSVERKRVAFGVLHGMRPAAALVLMIASFLCLWSEDQPLVFGQRPRSSGWLVPADADCCSGTMG
jgi:hypothetical protein